MRTLWCVLVVIAVTGYAPAPAVTNWRWFLALSETNRWSLTEGPATMRMTEDSVTGEFRDGSDTSRVRARFHGTVRGESAQVVVTLIGIDAAPFPANGRFQRLCSEGRGRELLMLIAEGGALGVTRDVRC